MKRLSMVFLILAGVVFALPAWARGVVVADIAVPTGFVVRPVVTDLEAPAMVAFDDDGRMIVAENGDDPMIIRVAENGDRTALVRGAAFGDQLPLRAVSVVRGRIIVAHGSVLSALEPSGEFRGLSDDDPDRSTFLSMVMEPARPLSASPLWGSGDDVILAAPEASRIERVHPDGSMEVLLENRIPSNAGGQGLGRPVYVTFSPDGGLVIVDEIGVIWRMEEGSAPSSSTAAGWTMFTVMFGGFVLGTSTFLVMRGGDRGLSIWHGAWRGAVASLVAGALMVGWLHVAVGYVQAVAVVVIGAGLGGVFARLLRTRLPMRVAIAGVVFGCLVWMVFRYVLVPVLWFVPMDPVVLWNEMIVIFGVFGLVLGGLVGVAQRVSRAPSTPRRRTVRRRRPRLDLPIELQPQRTRAS